ncbi:hypothetical protein G7077_08155 [Sphingomonas piscis]|uniref:DUF4124 domain-containing protein n=1 Tax=Sphingomonas piscis TaxID=2714943 RepID=A0A6G7YQ59_9SPHN|nr:hypothetical protein [Sphingomonas piscis]QIK78871.1 hypothetical protein G7077_08155 [Sphingomonas piscis]
MSKKLAMLGLALIGGTGLALAWSASATAQSQPAERSRSVPDSFAWKYGPDGRPVKKAKVTSNPDGSTREEVPLGGKCVRVVERGADGTVKRTDQC